MRGRLSQLADFGAWSRLRIWVIGFLAFFTLSAAWALATPLTAVPDEPSHMVKAAATIRGEFNGVPVIKQVKSDGRWLTLVYTGYKVPAQYAALDTMHDCYYAHINKPASCAVPMPDGNGEAIVGTSAGDYNPTYYFAVGWTSLINKGETGLYMMRLASAAICAALLASALATAAEWRRRKSYLLLGLATATTPTALFLNGSVNPNGVEVSAAILVWSGMLALLMDPQPGLASRRLTRIAVAGAVLVNVRPLGPLWCLGILMCAVMVSERGTLRVLLRTRATWVATGAVTLATIAAIAWGVHSNALFTSTVSYPQDTFMRAARYTFNLIGMYTDSMIGLFGWLDVPDPAGTRIAWYASVGFLTLLALGFSRRREALGIVGLIAAMIVIPVVAQAKQAQHLGYIWQGRYLLAVGVGLPLLASAVLAKRLDLPKKVTESRLLLTVLGVIGAGGFLAFYFTLHRYAVGANGPLIHIRPKWSPPGGYLSTILLYLVGVLLLLWPILASHLSSALPGQDSLFPTEVPEEKKGKPEAPEEEPVLSLESA